MSLYFGLIMFLCIVPTALITYYQTYPKNWKGKKLLFGVKNREEFQTGETLSAVEGIVLKYRSLAGGIVAGILVVSCLLLFLHGMLLQTTVWMTFILFAILALNIPFYLGNHELKALKRRIGLSEERAVTLVDLKSAGAVHALKPMAVLWPNLLGLLIALFSLLLDLKVIDVSGIALGEGWLIGSFLMTILLGSIFGMGLLLTLLAFLMDGLRNEVISEDSNVNANYNRAKKKNCADYFLLFLWGNTGFSALTILVFCFFYSDLLLLIALAVYLVIIMVGTAVFVLRQRKVEERYEKEITQLADDDDNWLLGQFYYNPQDSRLNVEKRTGMGSTFNFAHPMGKIICAFAGICLLCTVLSIVWIGMLEGTPLRLTVEDGKVICHQIRNDYVIPLDQIEEVTWGEDVKNLRLVRVSGVGMEDLLKGNFFVDDRNGCKVFLVPSAKHYVKIVAAGKTYYVSGSTPQETREAYERMK